MRSHFCYNNAYSRVVVLSAHIDSTPEKAFCVSYEFRIGKEAHDNDNAE